MSVLFSVASLYYHRSLQDLIVVLALISTASWIAVLLTTLVRFSVQLNYRRRTKHVLRERS